MEEPAGPNPNETLGRAHTEVTTDMGRVEAKVAALLSALGLPLAVLAAVVPNRHLPTAVAFLLGIAGAGMVAGAVAALAALLPLGVTGASAPGSFLRWAECVTADQVLDDLATDRRAARLIQRSQLLRRKFRMLRLAVQFGMAAVVFLALALAAALGGAMAR
ncbi:Pycsar system effector family protein [Kitasatospora sp. NPDC059463]|uniref:Pycsar system effector family protein n=1 Tax=unclassified Kitasatospora TaxID=2633591 RepID=UPI0036C2DE0A